MDGKDLLFAFADICEDVSDDDVRSTAKPYQKKRLPVRRTFAALCVFLSVVVAAGAAYVFNPSRLSKKDSSSGAAETTASATVRQSAEATTLNVVPGMKTDTTTFASSFAASSSKSSRENATYEEMSEELISSTRDANLR